MYFMRYNIAVMSLELVKKELLRLADKDKAQQLQRFFKTGEGEYGEGDVFIGISVPEQRSVVKKFQGLAIADVQTLLHSNVHEFRLTALLILVAKYKKTKNEVDQKAIIDLYLNNLAYINNWDLVDSSASYILGPYFFKKNRQVLFDLVNRKHLWSQRIAVMATFYFIKQGDFEDTLKMAEMLLNHKHDLMHKVVGWMLREIGKRDKQCEIKFLEAHYQNMPCTMLRYAIEKFSPDERTRFLKK
jgi:3-methyladenine DNA glycosylase AlkD